MSQLFDEITDHITAGTTALPRSAGTLALWWYPTTAKVDFANHFLVYSESGGDSFFSIFKVVNGDLWAGWVTGFIDHRAKVAAAGYTLNQNAWNAILLTWDDTTNETALYVNGVLAATNSTLVTFATATKYIGNEPTLSSDARGRVADVGVWPRVLTPQQIADHAAGKSYDQLGPAGTFHWPLRDGDLTDHWGGDDGTAAGTTAADPPPLSYPTLACTVFRSQLIQGKGFRDLFGAAAFANPAAVGSLAVPGLSVIQNVLLTPAGPPMADEKLSGPTVGEHGIISPTDGEISVARTGLSPTQGLKFFFSVRGW